jgi:hypothetical protein
VGERSEAKTLPLPFSYRLDPKKTYFGRSEAKRMTGPMMAASLALEKNTEMRKA